MNPYAIEVLYNLPGEKGETKTLVLFEKGCQFPSTKSLTYDQRKETLDVQIRYLQPVGTTHILGNFKVTPP